MKKDTILLIIGIALFIIGVALNILDIGADYNTVAEQATNAVEAGANMPENNRVTAIINVISMFLIGLGGLLSAIVGLKYIQKQNK